MLFKKSFIVLLFVSLFAPLCMDAQQKDTITMPSMEINPIVKKYNPNKAIIRSALIPGWGQITNKKYWKLPLVYGAIGTTTYLFFQNIKTYNEASEAYRLATDGDPSNDDHIQQPYYSVKGQPDRIKNFRNAVRQDVDYCVLFFILFWGLNVADAAVDAHLKTFDINDNLSLELKPSYSPISKTTGIGLVMHIK